MNHTARSYLTALERLMLVENQPPWAPRLRFAERVDTSRCGRPAALGVVVHSGYAHTRPAGVAVIPAGALGP